MPSMLHRYEALAIDGISTSASKNTRTPRTRR
jgi:hypothetical protein